EGRASVAGVDAEACHSPVLVQLGHGAAGGAVDVEVERAGLAELLEAAVPPGRYEGAGEELERELGRERVVDAKAEVERPLADVGEDVAGAEGAHGEGVVDAVEVLVVVELPPERGLDRDREGVAGAGGDPVTAVQVVLGGGAGVVVGQVGAQADEAAAVEPPAPIRVDVDVAAYVGGAPGDRAAAREPVVEVARAEVEAGVDGPLVAE